MNHTWAEHDRHAARGRVIIGKAAVETRDSTYHQMDRVWDIEGDELETPPPRIATINMMIDPTRDLIMVMVSF